jgi:riboflavin kinase/FMN adenylyltransferase
VAKREILKSSLHLKNSIKSIAIGSFDGIHLAHKQLIKKADAIVVIEHGFSTLTPGWRRSIYTQKPTYFYMLKKIKNLTPKEFIKKLKSDFPKLEKIVIGYDFAFGKDKTGNVATLKEHFKGNIEVVAEVKYNNISVHSRVIRQEITYNNIELANKLLDRAYTVVGTQIKGQGIGAKELVATINLKVLNYTLPTGVFAVNATFNNKSHKAIAFLGHRETTDNNFAIEVHILEDFNKNIIGDISIEFIKFIRKNRKFTNLNELKIEILKNIEQAKQLL